jgi:hypothetical protein
MARPSDIIIVLNQAVIEENGVFLSASKYVENLKLLYDVCEMLKCS